MQALLKTTLFGTLCLLLTEVANGEQQSGERGIEKLMTAEEYRRTGLHKLSQEELMALEAWFREHAGELDSTAESAPVAGATAISVPASGNAAGEAAAAARAEENFGFPEPRLKENEPVELHAEVLPPFRGWNGKTVFRLDNGQVWKQRSSGHHTYTGDDRRVVISKNAMGFYEMRLLAADRSIGVKRVK
jgi:hypothetical protein